MKIKILCGIAMTTVMFSTMLIPEISRGSDVSYYFNGPECLAMYSTGGGGGYGKSPSQSAYKGSSVKRMEMLGKRDELFASMDADYESQERTIKQQKRTIRNQQFEVDAANNRAMQAEQARQMEQNQAEQTRIGSDGTMYFPAGDGTYMNSRTGEFIR